MRCRNFPCHRHPPHMVTYSPDNRSATKYHCPDAPCGAKHDNTPYNWIAASVVKAHRQQYTRHTRVAGGLRFVADTTRAWGEGEFALRGAVDYERIFSGAETRVQVSGEPLRAVATEHSLRFGLNGIYRQGRFSIGAEVAARQELGSDDSEYASFVNLGLQF